MEFQINYSTDIGIRKQVNQDSLCIRKAKTVQGNLAMAVLCDGMGGLSYGEVASATVVRRFAQWFEQELPTKLRELSCELIKKEWASLVRQLNEKLWVYGKQYDVQLGTTVTAIFILDNGNYVIIHVGDSRAYRITKNNIEQLTEDQSLVAREVKKGNITKEQAAIDLRRNILLQCIGVSQNVEPECIVGNAISEDVFLLCTDGFRHKFTAEELFRRINGSRTESEAEIQQVLAMLVKENEERGETDNISAIMIKAL